MNVSGEREVAFLEQIERKRSKSAQGYRIALYVLFYVYLFWLAFGMNYSQSYGKLAEALLEMVTTGSPVIIPVVMVWCMDFMDNFIIGVGGGKQKAYYMIHVHRLPCSIDRLIYLVQQKTKKKIMRIMASVIGILVCL